MSVGKAVPLRQPSGSTEIERPKRMTLSNIISGNRWTPDKIVLFGQEKVGKTSFASEAPGVIFVSSEKGLEDIQPAPPRFPEAETFQDVLDSIDELINEEHPYKTVAFDTLDWIAHLVQEAVCQRNKWTPAKFNDYGQGWKIALTDWRQMIVKLERLQAVKGMEVILIAHAELKTATNVMGEDYPRFRIKMGGDAGPALFKEYAKSILFASYETVVVDGEGYKKAKGISTGRRVIHTEWNAAFDAGNRHGLPPVLPLSYQDYATARAAGQPASPEKLLAEARELLEQWAPPETKKEEIKTILVQNETNATSLAKIVNRLRTYVAEAKGE